MVNNRKRDSISMEIGNNTMVNYIKNTFNKCSKYDVCCQTNNEYLRPFINIRWVLL